MKYRESGFTIIETSLVLAVTGLVIAVILAGIGNSLNHQRYTDAVNQAVDFFRGQYTQGSSTVNNRPEDESCNASGVSTLVTPMTRGASDCLLLGKVLRSSNGEDITVNQVLGLHDPSDDNDIDTLSDTDILRAAQITEADQVDAYTSEWGTRFLTPGSNDDAQFTIMVVRIPVSGTIRTYSSSSATSSLSDLLNSSLTPQEDRRICIDQTGLFGIGVQPMGINITKSAANTTGVQIIPSGECT